MCCGVLAKWYDTVFKLLSFFFHLQRECTLAVGLK